MNLDMNPIPTAVPYKDVPDSVLLRELHRLEDLSYQVNQKVKRGREHLRAFGDSVDELTRARVQLEIDHYSPMVVKYVRLGHQARDEAIRRGLKEATWSPDVTQPS